MEHAAFVISSILSAGYNYILIKSHPTSEYINGNSFTREKTFL